MLSIRTTLLRGLVSPEKRVLLNFGKVFVQQERLSRRALGALIVWDVTSFSGMTGRGMKHPYHMLLPRRWRRMT